MRRLAFALALLAVFALTGCASHLLGQQGTASDDHTACNEVPPSPVTPATTEAAQARGGQEASNQPVQSDPGARGIQTTWARGGPATNSSSTTESRSQAGAPSVNQGLILPTEASVGGGGSPAVVQAAENVKMYRLQMQVALADPNTPAAKIDAISKMLSDAQVALATAESGSRPVVNFNLQNSTNTQTVANGSRSGGDGADSVGTAAARAARAPGGGTAVSPEPPPAPAPAPAPTSAPTSEMPK